MPDVRQGRIDLLKGLTFEFSGGDAHQSATKYRPVRAVRWNELLDAPSGHAQTMRIHYAHPGTQACP
jgi:hypothetical protein